MQSERESTAASISQSAISLSVDRFVSCFNQEDITSGDKINALLYVLPSLYRMLSRSIDTSGTSDSTKSIVTDEVLCNKLLVAIYSILLHIAANNEVQHTILIHLASTPETSGSKSNLLLVLNNVVLLLTFLMEGLCKAACENADAHEDLIANALHVYGAYMAAMLSIEALEGAEEVRRNALSAQVMPQVVQTFLQHCSSGSGGVRTRSALNIIAAITFADRLYAHKGLSLLYFPGIFSKLVKVISSKTNTDAKTRSYCLVAILTLYKFAFTGSGCSRRAPSNLDVGRSLQTTPVDASVSGDAATLSTFKRADPFFLATFGGIFGASSVKTQVVMLLLLEPVLTFVLSRGDAFAARHFYDYAMLLLPSTNSEYASVRHVATAVLRSIRTGPFGTLLVGSRLRGVFQDGFVGALRAVGRRGFDRQSLHQGVLGLLAGMQFLGPDVGVVIAVFPDALVALWQTVLATPLGGGGSVSIDAKAYRWGPGGSCLGKYYRAQSDLTDADAKRAVRKLFFSFGKVDGGVAFLVENIVRYNTKARDAASSVRRRGKSVHYYLQKCITFYNVLNSAYFGAVHKWLGGGEEALDPHALQTSPAQPSAASADACQGATPMFVSSIVGVSSSIIKYFIDNREIFESCLSSYSILISLVLENVALIFFYFGRRKRESLLLTFLYDTIVLLSESSAVISTAAETTLHLTSMYLNYAGLPFLLLENFDFLIEKSYAKFKIQKQTFYNDSNINAIDAKNVAFYNSFHILNVVFDQIGDIVKAGSAKAVMYNQKIRLYVVDLLKDIMNYIDFNSTNFVVSNAQISNFLSLLNIIFTKIIDVIFIHPAVKKQAIKIDDSIDDTSYCGDMLKLSNPVIRSFITSNIAIIKNTTHDKCAEKCDDVNEGRAETDDDNDDDDDDDEKADTSNDDIVKIMLDTLKRLIYFMTLENLRDKVLIIQVVYEMIMVLKVNNIQKISNIIYQIWPSIIEILKIEVTSYTSTEDMSRSKASVSGVVAIHRRGSGSNIVISRTLDLCGFVLLSSGDFFSVRFDDYLLPIVSRLLAHFFAAESSSSSSKVPVDYKKKVKSIRLTNDFEILFSLLKLVEGLVTTNRDQFNCDYVAYFMCFLIPFLSSDQTSEVRGIVKRIVDNFVLLDYTFSLCLYNLMANIAACMGDSKAVQWTEIYQREEVVSFLSNPKLRRAIELAGGSNVSMLARSLLRDLASLVARGSGGVLDGLGAAVAGRSCRAFEDSEVRALHGAQWSRELANRSYF